MLEFSRDEKTKHWSVEERNWAFRMDEPEQGLFTLRAGNLSVCSMEARFGEFGETMALDGYRRTHVSETGLELELDTENPIPFGTEPAVKRNFRIMKNSLTVVSDFVLRHTFEMRRITAGGLVFSGAVDRVRVMKLDERGAEFPKYAETEFSAAEDGSVLYDSETVPLMVEVTDKDGEKLSFHAGEDYWRWIRAGALKGKSRYRIFRKGDTVVFAWELYEFTVRSPEELPPPGRNWRLSWQLRWSFGKKDSASAKTKTAYRDALDLSALPWDDKALVTDADGNTLPYPCCSAAPVQNVMKKWLRGHLAGLQEGDVLAVKAVPHVCRASAHLGRGKQETLIHKDDMLLYEFQRWANRQLYPYGAELVLIFEKQENKK